MATLWWGVKRYSIVLLVCFLAGALLVPWYRYRAPAEYTSSALVVASNVESLLALPRYGTAVFDNGAVATAVSNAFGDAGDREDIVPKEASLVAAQDSIILEVQGHASTAKQATDTANVAAEAFVAELNKAGPGVGVFKLQHEAIDPVEAEEPFRAAPYSLLLGAFGGMVLGFGVICALLVWRRPVLHGSSSVAGLPILGTVLLPRGARAGTDKITETVGVSAVARRVLARSADPVLLHSNDRHVEDRHLLAEALAKGLEWGLSAIRAGNDKPANPSPLVTVIDGIDPVDHFGVHEPAMVLAVVRVGTPYARVRSLVADLDDSVAAVVLTRRTRMRRRGSVTSAAPPGNPDSRSATAPSVLLVRSPPPSAQAEL